MVSHRLWVLGIIVLMAACGEDGAGPQLYQAAWNGTGATCDASPGDVSLKCEPGDLCHDADEGLCEAVATSCSTPLVGQQYDALLDEIGPECDSNAGDTTFKCFIGDYCADPVMRRCEYVTSPCAD